jgi:hypothetical protein
MFLNVMIIAQTHILSHNREGDREGMIQVTQTIYTLCIAEVVALRLRRTYSTEKTTTAATRTTKKSETVTKVPIAQSMSLCSPTVMAPATHTP